MNPGPATADALSAARACLEAGDLTGSQLALKSYTPSDPARRRDARLWRSIVTQHLDSGNKDGAWRACREAIETGALGPEAQRSLGNAMMRRATRLHLDGQNAAALEWLDHEGCSSRPLLRASVLEALDRLDALEAELRRHERLDPSSFRDARLLRVLVRRRLQRGEWEEGWRTVSGAVARHRLDARDLSAVARVIGAQARTLEREQWLEEAEGLWTLLGKAADPVSFARVLMGLGRLDDAAAQLRQPKARGARGAAMVWRDLLRRGAAMGAWSRAAAWAVEAVVSGGLPKAALGEFAAERRRAAMSLARAGQADAALDVVEGTHDVLTQTVHARLLFQAGRNEEAVRLLRGKRSPRSRRSVPDEGGPVLILSGGSSGSHLLAVQMAQVRPFVAGPELNIANDPSLFDPAFFHGTALRMLLLPETGRRAVPLANGQRFFPVPPLFLTNAATYRLPDDDSAVAAINAAPDWPGFAASLAASLLSACGPRRRGRLVEHSPSCSVAAEAALAEESDLRAVHIVRDPRDAVASMFVRRKAQPLMRGLPEQELLRLSALQWCFLNAQADRASDRPGYLQVRYEDLVTDPIAVLRRVLHHCGATRAVRWAAGSASLTQASFSSTWQLSPTGPIRPSAIGSHRDRLRPALLRSLETLSLPELASEGLPAELGWYVDRFGYG